MTEIFNSSHKKKARLALTAGVFFVICLNACGNKGTLYRPEAPAQGAVQHQSSDPLTSANALKAS